MHANPAVGLGAGVVLLAVVLSAGCNTPTSICSDHRDAYNKAFARCGFGVELPVEWLTWSGGPCDGLPASCDDVTKITDAAKILNECIPALETIDCDALAAAPAGPSSCRASVYQFVGTGADRCSP